MTNSKNSSVNKLCKARKYITWLFMWFIFFSLTADIYGWDGKRKGFVFGFGAGPGFTSFTIEVPAYDINHRYIGIVETPRENKLAVALDVKVGYAPHNRCAGYVTVKGSGFGSDHGHMSNGLFALGVSYWFSQRAPSIFIAGGLGFSHLAWHEVTSPTWRGLGLFAGGGYELPHFTPFEPSAIEAYLFWGKPKHTQGEVELSSKTLSLMLVFSIYRY